MKKKIRVAERRERKEKNLEKKLGNVSDVENKKTIERSEVTVENNRGSISFFNIDIITS